MESPSSIFVQTQMIRAYTKVAQNASDCNNTSLVAIIFIAETVTFQPYLVL